MKLLVGLVVLGCGAPSHPLCDRTGAPACGNIGQTGRPAKAAIMLPRPVTAATHAIANPAVQRALLAPMVRAMTTTLVGHPLLDAESRPAPGNVMGKRGPRDDE